MRLSLATGRGWLALLLALTLLVRLAVPAGFMPSVERGAVALRLCPDAGPMPASPMMAMAGHRHHDPHGGDHGKAEAPCAFAGLGLAMTGPVAPTLLAAALAFAFVEALIATAPALPAPPERLRPPLRAPPLAA